MQEPNPQPHVDIRYLDQILASNRGVSSQNTAGIAKSTNIAKNTNN